MYAYVTGSYCDSWLSRLFPGAIGYSSHPYKMVAKVVKILDSGEAVVTGKRTEETSEYYRSNGDLLRKVIYTHFDTQPEIVPSGNWKLLTDVDIIRENEYRSKDNQL